jgi:hypothetical protein
MTKRYEPADGTPTDLRMLWDMNGTSLDVAEKAYRAWLDGAGRIQNETLGFLNGRFEKGLETARELTNCKTATEYFEVQARYADRAMSDWLEQGQKMVRLLGEMTMRTAQSAEEAGGEPKRAGRGGARSSH